MVDEARNGSLFCSIQKHSLFDFHDKHVSIREARGGSSMQFLERNELSDILHQKVLAFQIFHREETVSFSRRLTHLESLELSLLEALVGTLWPASCCYALALCTEVVTLVRIANRISWTCRYTAARGNVIVHLIVCIAHTNTLLDEREIFLPLVAATATAAATTTRTAAATAAAASTTRRAFVPGHACWWEGNKRITRKAKDVFK